MGDKLCSYLPNDTSKRVQQSGKGNFMIFVPLPCETFEGEKKFAHFSRVIPVEYGHPLILVEPLFGILA